MDAFGIDLSPLFQRMEELREMAEQETELREEIRNLRARALSIRANLATQAVCLEERERLEGIRRVLRRTGLTPQDLVKVIAELEAASDATVGLADTDQFSAANEANNNPKNPDLSNQHRNPVMHQVTPRMSASDGQNVRLEESLNIEYKKKNNPDPEETWERCEELRSFYPDIDPTPEGVVKVIYDFGRMLNVNERTLIKACHSMGVGTMLRAMDYLAKNAACIARPERYLDRMIRDVEAGVSVGWA